MKIIVTPYLLFAFCEMINGQISWLCLLGGGFILIKESKLMDTFKTRVTLH